MAIPPGRRLGPYEILSAIGAGGMGEVYKPGTRGWTESLRSRFCRRVRSQLKTAGPLHRPGQNERQHTNVLTVIDCRNLHRRVFALATRRRPCKYSLAVAEFRTGSDGCDSVRIISTDHGGCYETSARHPSR